MAGLTKEQRAAKALAEQKLKELHVPADETSAEAPEAEVLSKLIVTDSADEIITDIPPTPEMSDENKSIHGAETPQTNLIMEEPKKFSELDYKAELVIKNANGNDQIVTKRFWEKTREGDLDRLQGIELLGLAKRGSEPGKYETLPIVDDWEAETAE